jgi:alanine-glyoxylate transaminase/serine-glyoxylate transaminase/serine-pyruvate transaminase
LTTVVVPEGVDSKAVCVFVLEKYHMEIGNGLGELLGKVWRRQSFLRIFLPPLNEVFL